MPSMKFFEFLTAHRFPLFASATASAAGGLVTQSAVVVGLIVATSTAWILVAWQSSRRGGDGLSGVSGPPAHTLGRSVFGLAHGLHRVQQQELEVIRTDIERLRALLHDAFATMSACFNEIGRQAERQVAAVQTLVSGSVGPHAGPQSGGEPLDPKLRTLLDVAERLTNAVNDAIRSMQFEDIGGQLLGNADKHLRRLQELLPHVQTIAETVSRSTNRAAVGSGEAARILEIEAMLSRLAAEWEDSRTRPVAQSSMSDGSVELFRT